MAATLKSTAKLKKRDAFEAGCSMNPVLRSQDCGKTLMTTVELCRNGY